MNLSYVKEMIDKELWLLKEDNKRGKIPPISFTQLRNNLYYIIDELEVNQDETNIGRTRSV